MSYCIAWKKNEQVFMLSESAISSFEDDIQAGISTFGEVQGLYGKYYVQEGLLKIIKINDDFVLGVSGDVPTIIELLTHVYSLREMLTLEILRNIITNNYQDRGISAIVVEKGRHPQIYLFEENRFSCTDRCEIGAGRKNAFFSADINQIIDQEYAGGDEHDYLAKVIGCAQCYSIKNRCIQEGYGGTFYGVVIGSKIEWFRDMGYYIFKKDIQDGFFTSVINRRDSVFSTSNFSDHTIFMLNFLMDKEVWENPYFKRAVMKSLHTKNPFYFFIYSSYYHVAFYIRMNSESQNFFLKRWIKRNNDDVYCAFAFRPELEEMCVKYANETSKLPTLVELPSIREPYMPHELAKSFCDIPDRLSSDVQKHMDFDFSLYSVPGYDLNCIVPIKRAISEYHNLVLVDFHYFYSVCNEIYGRYHKLHDIDVSKMDLRPLVSLFLNQIAENDFDKYLLVFVKEVGRSECLDGVDLSCLLTTYKNVEFIEVPNFETDLCGTLFLLFKNYYLNDRFFHLDKFVIAADNIKVNELLSAITPEFNLGNSNPDIVLIRNMNGMTAMDGRFRYAVIDYWIVAAFGIPFKSLGILDALLENECGDAFYSDQ